MRSRFTKILLILLALLTLCGCANAPETADSMGVSIDIPKDMKNATGHVGYQGYTFAYVGNDMAVFATKGDLTAEGAATDLTLEDFAKRALEIQGLEAEIQTSEKGYVYFVYDADTGINEFTNVTALYQNGNDMWMIHVSTKQKKYDEAEVFAILDSVSFS